MISDDMMSFIKKDIVVFASGFLFYCAHLWLIFRNLRLVLIPLLGCASSVIIMIIYLALLVGK